MDDLPERLYTAAQTRALDATAIEGHGVPGYTLMSRAGAVCFCAVKRRWPEARSIDVLCGGGNNGGDGYVVAKLAVQAGWTARVIAVSDPDRLQGDAATARDDWVATGGAIEPWSGDLELTADVLVDALLGTGLDREVGGRYQNAVERINGADRPVLAVDIPSGLSADSGSVLGCAVRADVTASFIGLKRGLVTGAATERTGSLVFDDLEVPPEIYQEVESSARLLDQRLLDRLLSPRSRNAHKGSHGSVLVIGGDAGMSGAVCLAGSAALRAGAGLVKVATRADHAAQIPLARTELMSAAVEDEGALEVQLEWADVLALGPGLGQGGWSHSIFERASRGPRPMVVDADGLNLLAEAPRQRQDWILTPHPGEAARLLQCSTPDVQQDRFAAASAIAEQYGGVCVLKGAGTVIAGTNGLRVCRLGNPGMATAGMGDVLTGVVAAMLAQGHSLEDAADLGVCAHAAAGDVAAQSGERGLIASDVIGALRNVVNR